jgi:Family of unknown function (DUF6011)/Domain of unknown function (DUF1897)
MNRPGKLAKRAQWYRSIGDDVKAEALEAQLARAHRCRRCGRPLTDPESVAAAVGPDCEAKIKHAVIRN